MTARTRDVDRKVIPRFHSAAAAAHHGESASAKHERPNNRLSQNIHARGILQELRDEWEANRSPSFAADYVAAALVLGAQDEARDVAESLAVSSGPTLRRRLAQRLLGIAEPDDENLFDGEREQRSRQRIRDLKRMLRSDPRTALLWSELARDYASMGQRIPAARAMDLALALAPNNRIILRSAARLSIHLDDPERAHRILRRADGVRTDPWLLAGEIAVASLTGQSSRLLRHGRRLLASQQFRPLATSELAAALATEAFTTGSRDAKRLFAAALAQPTENALAQAEWASRRGAVLEINDQLANVEDSWEARAQAAAQSGEGDAAIAHAWRWLRSEPFASLPATFGSHEAAVARRYDEAASFAQAGLIANPDDRLLRNNLVFALASADHVDQATRELAAISEFPDDDELQPVVTATRGLVAFRQGNNVLGQQLYEHAIQTAKDPALRAVAAILLAREQLRADIKTGPATRRFAQQLAAAAKGNQQTAGHVLAAWLDHLDAEIAMSSNASKDVPR